MNYAHFAILAVAPVDGFGAMAMHWTAFLNSIDN